jgi:hypothetical protein
MKKEKPESPVKPQVIDLDVEEVTVEETIPDASEAPQPPPPPEREPVRKKTSSVTLPIIALLAGTAIGGWLYKDVLASYLPSNEMQSAKNSIETLQAQNKTLAEQVAAISAASDDMKTKLGSLSSELQSSAGANSSFESRITAAEAATKSAQAEIEKLKSRPSGGTTVTAADSGALASLAQRLDALEKDVASLKTTAKPAGQSAMATTLSQSLADLKAKIASGASYRAEFDRISRMVPAAAGLETLGAHADEGLPAPQGLAKELTDLIPLLPKPETQTTAPDASYLSGFWNMMSGLVTIRKIGEADWPALASQCAALAESGDLSQAIAKIDTAEGVKPVAISNWRDRAAARIALEKAVDDTAQAVARQVTSLGATP